MSRGKNKIKVDYGMPDYYKHYCKTTEEPVDKHLFREIINDFNNGLQELIIHKGLIYQFPKSRFELMLKKVKVKPKVKDGKLLHNLPVDWPATKKLWKEHPDAKEKKLLIRITNSHTDGFVFRVYFKKFKSTLKLKSLYKFKIIRGFARNLSENLKKEDSDVDAFLLY